MSAPWATTRPQLGQVLTGPGTLSGAVSTAKTDTPGITPAAQPSAWGKVFDSVNAQRAAESDSGQPYGNDAGTDYATAEQVDALHAKVDVLQGSVSGMASSGSPGGGGQQGNVNLQGLTPLRMPTRREAPPSPLEQSAQQRQSAMDRMAQSGQNLRNTRANFSQASAGGIAPPKTTNAMSSGFAEKSFFGQFGSGIGSAPSTWDSAKRTSR